LNWKEVWYTNCPVVSASNVDESLGWVREEFKKIGVRYAYFRSTPLNDWYPHYIHNLDNLFRVGGLFPPVHVHADIRRTRLLGATHVYEGGCMMVRAGEDIYRMADLAGKKIGLSKSLNAPKSATGGASRGAGYGASRQEVEIVEFPYPDDWYSNPKMLVPMENPTELWLTRDHKHDLSVRPLEAALLKGTVDAI
jgi:ABC-type nitrate/sulfonate/bicarbonate transport system substrate-binding protein